MGLVRPLQPSRPPRPRHLDLPALSGSAVTDEARLWFVATGLAASHLAETTGSLAALGFWVGWYLTRHARRAVQLR